MHRDDRELFNSCDNLKTRAQKYGFIVDANNYAALALLPAEVDDENPNYNPQCVDTLIELMQDELIFGTIDRLEGFITGWEIAETYFKQILKLNIDKKRNQLRQLDLVKILKNT